MKKICFIATISLTLKSFVLKTAEYIHYNTDWDISFICDMDDEFEQMLPEYIHYYPVRMRRGVNLDGINAILEMRSIFKREKFDLIQYSTPNASLYASIAGLLAKTPVRLYCQWGMVFVGYSGLKRKIFKLIEKSVCRLSTWIEPDSYSNLHFSHEQGLYSKSKSSVVWNGSACGIDLIKFDITKKVQYREYIRNKYGIPSDTFIFGFVGRVTKEKGVNELLQAFKRLDDSCYLMMVGSNEVDETINSELYEWSVKNERVIYVGYTNSVEQYLSAMDCFVLPSYREGFGMGITEAEAMGVPVIVSDIPGPIDAMENERTGVIVPVKNEDALHSAMCWVMKNRDIAQLYGQAGIVYVKERFEQKKLQKLILEDRIRLLRRQKSR